MNDAIANPHDRVEVLIGVMSGMFREDKAGNYDLVPYYSERPKVLVELVDTNGDRQGAWDGEDMAEAFRQASRISRMLNVPVVDLTKEGARQ
jgi:hypothetical protein